MNFSITQNGKPLAPSKYTWDEKTKTFSTNETNLVLDFSWLDFVTFSTGSSCTFTTGSNCTFTTGSNRTFTAGYSCTFKTGYDCTFDTGSYCTFKTGHSCTFKTGFDCTFTCGEKCVVVRRDAFEVIHPQEGKTIKLNGYNVTGFTYINEKHVISIDGKEVELSQESYENLKKLFDK